VYNTVRCQILLTRDIDERNPDMERKQPVPENTKPFIFPYPRKSETLEGGFVIDEQTVILLPDNPSQNDTFFARFLSLIHI